MKNKQVCFSQAQNKRLRGKEDILKEIKDYIAILLKHNIRPKKVILFGSFAKNRPSRHSDIDLAVVADNFGKDEIKEMMELKKLSIRVSDRIEPIPLSEKYLTDKYHPLIGEIKKYGKIVFSS